jgi:hypothetical protein
MNTKDRSQIVAAIEAGADPNWRMRDGDPIIMRFMNDRDCEGIRWLKAKGANLELRTRAGDALITDAAIAGDWDVVWCLLQLGADPMPPGARLSLPRLLQTRSPSKDSPIYPYKRYVWQHLQQMNVDLPSLE